MADSFPSDWSTTAASNTTIGGGVSIAENCAAANINNAIRAVMAGVKGALTYVATSGTDTYTATLAPAITAYVTGAFYFVNFATANTSTTPTLNLNTIGAKTIKDIAGNAVAAGQLNGPHILTYDGTNLRALNSALLSLKLGGTAADLSATGGTSQVLKQASAGAAITVAQLAASDLSDVTAETTWTPADASGATLTFSNVVAKYTKVGNLVIASVSLTYPTTANGSGAAISGFPVNFPNVNSAQAPFLISLGTGTAPMVLAPIKNSGSANIISLSTGNQVTNATLSTQTINVTAVYLNA